MTVFAHRIARTLGIIITRPTVNPGFVGIVASRLRRFVVGGIAPVRVLSVTDSGQAPVYNLTVQGANEFFAEGVLVHNSDALAMTFIPRGGMQIWV